MGTGDNGVVFPGSKMGIMCIRSRIDFVGTDFLITNQLHKPIKEAPTNLSILSIVNDNRCAFLPISFIISRSGRGMVLISIAPTCVLPLFARKYESRIDELKIIARP